MRRLLRILHARRRLLVALAFVAFAGVFFTGVVRVYDYSWQMATGNYAAAATYNSPYNAPRGADEPPPVPGFEYEPSWDERALVWVMERYQNYADGAVGNRVLATFDLGLSLYEKYQYELACGVLHKAFASCCDSNGKVLPQHRRLASDIQLLIGNTHANRQKFEDAIAAYEVSLRMDPDNIVTTYNLEKLQDPSGGGGKDDKKDKPQPQGPVSPKKRI